MTKAVLLALALVFAGCGKKEKSDPVNPPKAEAAAETRSVQEIVAPEAVSTKLKQTEAFDLQRFNEILANFYVDHGRRPTNLNELVAWKYIPCLPTLPAGKKLVIDAKDVKAVLVDQ